MPRIQQCNIRPPHLGFDCPCALCFAEIDLENLENSEWKDYNLFFNWIYRLVKRKLEKEINRLNKELK